jgi:hypothetical protein
VNYLTGFLDGRIPINEMQLLPLHELRKCNLGPLPRRRLGPILLRRSKQIDDIQRRSRETRRATVMGTRSALLQTRGQRRRGDNGPQGGRARDNRGQGAGAGASVWAGGDGVEGGEGCGRGGGASAWHALAHRRRRGKVVGILRRE